MKWAGEAASGGEVHSDDESETGRNVPGTRWTEATSKNDPEMNRVLVRVVRIVCRGPTGGVPGPNTDEHDRARVRGAS